MLGIVPQPTDEQNITSFLEFVKINDTYYYRRNETNLDSGINEFVVNYNVKIGRKINSNYTIRKNGIDNKYLSFNSFIVNSSLIRSKTKELTNSLDGNFDKVCKLVFWIKKTLFFNESVDKKTSYWAYRNIEGSSREFSYLLLSSLRSIDIPSRLIFGYAKFDGNWKKHYWVEVPVSDDKWIALDPTLGEIGQLDAYHIKMSVGYNSEVVNEDLDYEFEVEIDKISKDRQNLDLDISVDLSTTKTQPLGNIMAKIEIENTKNYTLPLAINLESDDLFISEDVYIDTLYPNRKFEKIFLMKAKDTSKLKESNLKITIFPIFEDEYKIKIDPKIVSKSKSYSKVDLDILFFEDNNLSVLIKNTGNKKINYLNLTIDNLNISEIIDEIEVGKIIEREFIFDVSSIETFNISIQNQNLYNVKSYLYDPNYENFTLEHSNKFNPNITFYQIEHSSFFDDVIDYFDEPNKAFTIFLDYYYIILLALAIIFVFRSEKATSTEGIPKK